MSVPSYNRQEQPAHRPLMTVVGDAYTIYTPPTFSDRWTEPKGPGWPVRFSTKFAHWFGLLTDKQIPRG